MVLREPEHGKQLLFYILGLVMILALGIIYAFAA